MTTNPQNLGALPETKIMDFMNQVHLPLQYQFQKTFWKHFKPWMDEFYSSFDEEEKEKTEIDPIQTDIEKAEDPQLTELNKKFDEFEKDLNQALAPKNYDEAAKKAKGLLGYLLENVGLYATALSAWHLSRFQSVVPSEITATLPISDKNFAALKKSWIHKNVGLIESLAKDQKTVLKTMLFEAFENGTLLDSAPTGTRFRNREGKTDLTSQIMKRFEVTESKARLLARDQSGKFHGLLTEFRMRQVGIMFYTWRTSGANNTRPMHKKLQGKLFHVDHPPIVNKQGDKKAPGGDYQCLCHFDKNSLSRLQGLTLDDYTMNPDNSLTLKESK